MLPGLCHDYCLDYWNQCRYTLSLLLEDLGQQATNLTTTLEEDSKKFCDFLGLKDKQYCYPNVLSNTGKVNTHEFSKTVENKTEKKKI